MADINVKDIHIKAIDSKSANAFVRKHHYSGKVVPNSQLHFGAFYNDRLHGVMSFGASMDKRKTQGLVKGTGWNEFTELNRMAFDDYLPKNSESRAISVAIRLIKKHAPQIKWIISFADATQCGDGTIYRASGFVLTNIKTNSTLVKLDDGRIVANMTYSKGKHILKTGGAKSVGKPIDGFQLRYVYFIDKSYQDKLTVPIVPFKEIDNSGAGMYKGDKIRLDMRQKPKSKAPNNQLGEGGAVPTLTHHNSGKVQA